METEKQLIPRLYQNKENGKWIVQTNDEHQGGIAKMATSFSGLFGLPSWGHTPRMLRDRGKEHDVFQQHIRMTGNLSVANEKSYGGHRRAFAGGVLITNLMGESVFNLLASQIISHHTGLHDHIDVESVIEKRQLPRETNKGDTVLNIPQLRKEFLRSPFSKLKVGMKHFHYLSRMLFPYLMDADRLNTEQFMDVGLWEERGCSSIPIDLLLKLEVYLRELQLYAPDIEMNYVRKKVQERCRKTSSEEKGFYSLTVPTGGGKTLLLLLWAMKHAVSHSMDRIIIAISYTNTIVQTAGLPKEILGEEHVLEYHSNFNPNETKNEEVRKKAELVTEDWNYSIIVMTNVQLFEPMSSNRPSDYRKSHSIMSSTLILDEAQTLPAGSLQSIVDALRAYRKIFRASILSTIASQSVFSGLIKGTNPRANFEGISHIVEIISDEFILHDKPYYVRLVIDNVGKTYDGIAAEVAIHNKVLCIASTRKDAKELYDCLSNEGVKLHLSRMTCPTCISGTIWKVKTLLKDKSYPTVRAIAIQLVEAGVDTGFPVVFRQEPGPDSTLQAAGRCNRKGRDTVGTTFVFSLTAGKCTPLGTMRVANNTRLNLSVNNDQLDPSTMTEYSYQSYCRKNTFDDKDMKHYLYNPIRKQHE